jgi:hypothetical protein
MAKEREQNKAQAIQWPNEKVQNKVQAIQWPKKKYKIMYRQSNGKRKSSLSAFSGVRVTRSLVLCVCFVDRCLFFCTFSFGHYCVVSSSIYGFSLLLWYFQILLNNMLVVSYFFFQGCD